MARKNKKIMTGDKIEFVSGNYVGLTGEVIATDYDSKDKRVLYGYLHTVKLDNGKIGFIEKSEHWRFL